MKKTLNYLVIAVFAISAAFTSCDKNPDDNNGNGNGNNNGNTEEGVVINGVKWATRNVAAPGTFAAKPEDKGMFYQWNRNKGWPSTGAVTGWDNTLPEGDSWEKSNDPCPSGWRVPTHEEHQSLVAAGTETATLNGVSGRYFGTGSQKVFYPYSGYLFADGSLNPNGGYYWSNTLYPDNSEFVYILVFNAMAANEENWTSRNCGLAVRCVKE